MTLPALGPARDAAPLAKGNSLASSLRLSFPADEFPAPNPWLPATLGVVCREHVAEGCTEATSRVERGTGPFAPLLRWYAAPVAGRRIPAGYFPRRAVLSYPAVPNPGSRPGCLPSCFRTPLSEGASSF